MGMLDKKKIQLLSESLFYKRNIYHTRFNSSPYILTLRMNTNSQDELLLIKRRLKHLRDNLLRASGRKHPQLITVTIDYLYDLGELQSWKCAISNDPLEFVRGGSSTNPRSCTIDRIDSDYGYIPGNVQLLTWEVNCGKNMFTNEAYVSLAERITRYQSSIQQGLE
jgi:hypothetical protein